MDDFIVLTPLEQKVASYGANPSTRDIASRMGIYGHTVASVRQDIKLKVGARSFARAIEILKEKGII